MNDLSEILQAALDGADLEKSRTAAPIGTRSKDGKYIKTMNGWEHAKTGQRSHSLTVHLENQGKIHKKEIHGIFGKNHEDVMSRAQKILQNLQGKHGAIKVHRMKVEATHDEPFLKSTGDTSKLLESLEKAMIMTNVIGVNLNTNENTIDEASIQSNPWTSQIQKLADGLKPGEPSVCLALPNKELYLEKLDDGLFSAYVRENDPSEGEYGKLLTRMPQMGLASIIHALILRGYIPNTATAPAPIQPESSIPYQNPIDLEQKLSALNSALTSSNPNKLDKDVAFEMIEDLVAKHELEWEGQEGSPVEQEEDSKMLDLVRTLLTFSKSAKDDVSEVASIAVLNGDSILMGKRRDNGRWTNPGGHLDKGEEKEEGAVRELFEEAGIRVNPKDLKFLGTKKVVTYTGKNKIIHAFSYDHQGERPTTKNDPDKEVSKWEWVDTSKGLAPEVIENLHSPQNLVLQKLRLLPKEVPLEKAHVS